MMTIRHIFSFTAGVFILFSFGCKKDKTDKTGVPALTTIEITNILPTTAMSGGIIASNGGAEIAISGICWSKTNNNPTISDDTTKNTMGSGSFIAMLRDLSPSSTYYVRAYATNRIGTGYGNVITFSTGNGAPSATAVSISGDAKANALLIGSYSYSDAEGDPESNTTFQWYVANDGTGLGEEKIAGATANTFRVTDAQQGKYIRFSVTPKSSAGNPNGNEVKSSFFGAIGEATTVTFKYNGADVTYSILVSTKTGKKWLDRNLGADRMAQSASDYLAYGDLFQWGRAGDGHQIVTRIGTTNTDATFVATTTSLIAPFGTSNNDTPGNNKFIVADDGFGASGDWRTTPNNDLWQGVNGTNNPCPVGWRIATREEWIAEGITNIGDGFNKLKLSYTGVRLVNPGTMAASTTQASYWTSTTKVDFAGSTSWYSAITSSGFLIDGSYRGMGMACRCIKDK